MNKEKSLEQFKKSINLMFENNDKEIYLNKDDALKIEYYIYSLEQQVKKQKEVINKIRNAIDGDIDGFATINEHGECTEILELLEIYKDILKEVE